MRVGGGTDREVSWEVEGQGVWQVAGEMGNGRLDGVELSQVWFYKRKCGERRPEGREEFPGVKIRWKLVGDQPGARSPGFQLCD